jgi:CheY-like chemotaxis protein
MSLRALVVDDSMLIRHSVSHFLETRGFIVEAAANGEDALVCLKSVYPNVVITDLDMPKMGGVELIEALKACAGTAGIPIIVVAGRQSCTTHGKSVHADFIIYKDIDLDEQLTRALQMVLDRPLVKSAAAH